MKYQGIQQDSAKSGQRYCCSKECIKAVLIFFNLLVALCGLAVCILGGWMLLSRHHYIVVLAGELFYLGHFLFAICGGLVFAFAILGFVGIFMNRVRLLWIYVGFLIALLMVEVAVCAIGFVFASSLNFRLQTAVKATMISRYRVDPSVTKAVDELHKAKKCCGSVSWRDWRDSDFYRNNSETTGEYTPPSCCRSPAAGCSKYSHPSNIYHPGCSVRLAQELYLKLMSIALCALGVAVVLLLSIVLACSLIHTLGQQRAAVKKRLR